MEAILKLAALARILRTSSVGAILTFLACSVLVGCATSPKGGVPSRSSGDNPSAEVMGPPEPFGPNPSAPAPPEVYGPAPIQARPIVLVLGPGMARGFAFAGVLRSLHDSRISIGAILGTEIGGLMAALYAMDGNINDFEWALMKYREEAFQADRRLLSRIFDRSAGASKLETVLEQTLGNSAIENSRIPLRLAIESKATGLPELIEKGLTAQAVRAAMATADADVQWNGVPARSALSRPFLVSEAKALGIGPVIVVNVMPELSGNGDLKEADLVVEPNMKGIGIADFSKRTEAAYRGKRAIKDRIREIRRQLGLPEDGTETGGRAK